MNTKLYLHIAFRIVIFFSLGMAFTYVPDNLRDFFGDTPAPQWYIYGHDDKIDVAWKWGARHYWYFWMMVFLSTLSVVAIILDIDKLIKKYQ